MAEDPRPQASHHRRSSFAGQTFADLFGNNRTKPPVDNGNSSPPNPAGPISQAAAQAQRRRMSLTTLGLSGSSPGTSPYNTFRGRRDSISSANSGSIDESAIEDDSCARDPNNGSTPTTPFARRMSFGARALRDVRNGSGGGGGGGTAAGQNGRSPPAASSSNNTAIAANANGKAQNGTISSRDAKGRGSADFWNENMRARAERTSIAPQPGGGGVGAMPPMHNRAKSVATMEQPIREMPKESQRPDHFQERILKGDFYMD